MLMLKLTLCAQVKWDIIGDMVMAFHGLMQERASLSNASQKQVELRTYYRAAQVYVLCTHALNLRDSSVKVVYIIVVPFIFFKSAFIERLMSMY